MLTSAFLASFSKPLNLGRALYRGYSNGNSPMWRAGGQGLKLLEIKGTGGGNSSFRGLSTCMFRILIGFEMLVLLISIRLN